MQNVSKVYVLRLERHLAKTVAREGKGENSGYCAVSQMFMGNIKAERTPQ